MDDATFWGLIDRAREGAGRYAPSADPDRLRAILEKEDDATVTAFGTRFYEEVARLNRMSVWGAGFVMDDDISDDSFHYFRSWIVGKGKATMEQALADPDGLVNHIYDPEEIENELLEYVAVEIMAARGGEDPRGATEADADAEPEGGPFDGEAAVYAAYPRLTAAFG